MKLNSRRTRGCATSQTTLLAVALLTFLGAGALWSVSSRISSKHVAVKTPELTARQMPVVPAQAGSRAAFAKLPIAFEPNQGQTDASASYIAHGSGYGLVLAPSEAVLSLGGKGTSAAVHMQLEGAAANPVISPSEPLPGKSNYLRGNDPSRWVRNVPTFARVQYSAVYPGIDLVYYGHQGQLEYDFAVRSGADPKQIRLQIAGADRVSLGTDGSLRLKTSVREVRWNKPVVYQEVDGQRRNVEGRFQLLARNRVGFVLGPYDRSRDLIIDPILGYATYFGGTGDEVNPQIALDVNSNIYLSGTTSSAVVPHPACGATGQPICSTLSGTTDVFVSKLDPIGSSVTYTTYLNGLSLPVPTAPTTYGNATGTDSSAGLVADNQGNVYVTGTTTSSDFPVTPTAFQSAPKAAGAHVFLTKLDSTGTNLLYSSYLSGTGSDNAMSLAADNTGHAYILGWTTSVASGDFPTGTSFQQSPNNATRLYFVAKFDTTLSLVPSLKFFSYLGGGDSSHSATPVDGVGAACNQLPCGGITLDSTGDAFVAVGTLFSNMPVINAYQAQINGGLDAYIVKISPDGGGLLYGTYFGGAGDDIANAIALDSSGNAYVAGSATSATSLPVGTVKGILTYGGGATDGFIAKLSNPTSGVVALTFSSFLGGTGDDVATSIVTDTTQNAYVVGSTTSPNFPVPINGTSTPNSGTDAFLVKLNTSIGFVSGTSSPVAFSKLFGGSGTDRATGMALNPTGSVLITGETNSANFPVQSQLGISVLQPALGGLRDAFLANFGPQTDLALTITTSASLVAAGNVDTFTYTVKNNGPDPSAGAVLTIPVPAASGGYTLGAFPTTCAVTGTAVESCTLGTITSGNSTSVAIQVTASNTSSNTPPATLTMSGHVVPGNSAVDSVPGNNFGSATATVETYTTNVSPTSVSVAAGATASYLVTVTPDSTNGFAGTIALSCVQPTTPVALAGAACTFAPTSLGPIAKNTGATTSVLKITTTKPTATASVHGTPTLWYALWLPLCGLALFGAGSTRRRRWMSGAAFVILLGAVSLLPACGKKSSGTPTNGTQTGTYLIQIKASSGSFTNPPTTNPLTVTLIVTPP